MAANCDEARLATLSRIERFFSKNAIMWRDEWRAKVVSVVSSGSLALDMALGFRDYPKGRIVKIDGPENLGKSMLALHAVAEAQKTVGTALDTDAKRTLDAEDARVLGADADEMLLSRPDSGAQALEMTDKMVTSSAVDIAVVDHIAFPMLRTEREGELNDSDVALHACLMSQVLRKLTEIVARAGNQISYRAEDNRILTADDRKENRNRRRGDRIRGERGWTKAVRAHHDDAEEGIRLKVKDRPVRRRSASHRQTVPCEVSALAPEHERADALFAGRWLAHPSAPVALAGDKDAGSEAGALVLGMVFANGSCIVSGARGSKPGPSMLRFAKLSDAQRVLVASAVEPIGAKTPEVGSSWVSVSRQETVARRRDVHDIGGVGLTKRILHDGLGRDDLRGVRRLRRAIQGDADFLSSRRCVQQAGCPGRRRRGGAAPAIQGRRHQCPRSTMRWGAQDAILQGFTSHARSSSSCAPRRPGGACSSQPRSVVFSPTVASLGSRCW